MSIKTIGFVVLFCALIFSCHRKKSLSINSAVDKEKEFPAPTITPRNEASADKILFINIECFKKKNGEDTCAIMNTIDANGKLKDVSSSHSHAHDGDVNEYVFSLLSCSGSVLYEEHMDNPLSSKMESYNEGGKIEMKEVSFDRREVSLRVQQQSDKFCKLKVEKRTNNKSTIICLTNL